MQYLRKFKTSDEYDSFVEITNEDNEQRQVLGKDISNIVVINNNKKFQDNIQTELQKYVSQENFVKDENYVHTDNNFTDEDKAKLSMPSNSKLFYVAEQGFYFVDSNMNIGVQITDDGIKSKNILNYTII